MEKYKWYAFHFVFNALINKSNLHLLHHNKFLLNLLIVHGYLFHELVGDFHVDVVRDVFLVGGVAVHDVFAVRVIGDVHFGLSRAIDDVRLGVFHGAGDALDAFREVRGYQCDVSREDCGDVRNCDESEL